MSEQISKELLKIMNEISNNETTASKIDASIFVRNSEKMINEKVAYLFNILKIEAKNCDQKSDKYFKEVELIIAHYKQKLNMVYDEFYCQYVNIQNEIQEAKINRRIAMINYQKIINDKEKILYSKEYNDYVKNKQDLLFKLKLANTQEEYDEIYKKVSLLKSPLKDDRELKEVIKKKNEIYKNIIDKCNLKFSESKKSFDKIINENFVITSKSLQIVSEQNIFKFIISKFTNIFEGKKKYTEILKQYNKIIDNIDAYEIVEQMRSDTIDFVTNILEMREIDKNYSENVRIGGKNG